MNYDDDDDDLKWYKGGLAWRETALNPSSTICWEFHIGWVS
jgi:hypothetical protein